MVRMSWAVLYIIMIVPTTDVYSEANMVRHRAHEFSCTDPFVGSDMYLSIAEEISVAMAAYIISVIILFYFKVLKKSAAVIVLF